ncbi:MAG TPA: porin family protein [Brumimicrobium sp.]|nr:porin family protein [Brumimicrobium sp.]
MKISIAAFLIICIGSFSYSQIRIAPEVGANLSSYASKYDFNNSTISNNSKYQLGARVGAILDLGINDHFAIQPGVYYNMARAKDEITFLGATFSETSTVHSLQIPLYFMFRTAGSDEGHLFVGVGPVFDWNFGGSVKGGNSKRDLEFGNNSSTDDMRPLDFGASATIGFKLEMGAFVRAYYNLGLSNLSPKDNNNNNHTLRSRSFGLSFGYFL